MVHRCSGAADNLFDVRRCDVVGDTVQGSVHTEQFMAESSSSDSTSVADTAELGVTGYNVADANRPWSRRVSEMPM